MDVKPEGLVGAFAEPHRALGNSEAKGKHEVRLLLHALIDQVRERATATPQNPLSS